MNSEFLLIKRQKKANNNNKVDGKRAKTGSAAVFFQHFCVLQIIPKQNKKNKK